MAKLNRQRHPEFQIPDQIDLPNPKKIILSSGVPVYLIKAGTEQITRVDLIFRAGTRYQDKFFVAGATNSLLSEGTTTMSGEQIAEKIDSFGSYIFPFYDHDDAGIQIYSLDKQLEATLDIVWDITENPVFPDKEIQIFQNNRIQSLLIDRQRVEQVARRGFNKKLFGEKHPYGMSGDVEDVQKLNRKLLQSFHKHYTKENLIIIITGPNCDDYIPVLEKGFANQLAVSDTPKCQNNFPVPEQVTNGISYQNVDNATQVALRLGRIVPDRQHPDYLLLMVLNTVLGGYFGSRLMQNIREDKGYTYGIGSGLISMKEVTLLSIASNLGTTVYEQAIEECHKEMKRLQDVMISESELSRVRNYIIGDLQRQLDGPFGLADIFKSLLTNQLDFSFVNRLLTAVQKSTAKDLIEIAQRYLNPENFTVFVAGPPKK